MGACLKQLLCYISIFCCIIESRGFNVSKEAIADAWQSSWYTSDGCFRSSSARQGQWDYFHSSGTPDPSGYQWLLLKLTRCVRVRSVTVYGRLEAPAAERVRALGIEVLLSDKKPAGLTENPPACTASFNHRLTGFRPCGITKNSGSSELAHEVTCSVRDYSKLTQFVLLRKFVANETDKYMNFRLLEIEEAYFCRQKKGNCSVRELSNLKQNDRLLIRAWLPCKLAEPGAPNCSIRMRNGSIMSLSIKVKTLSFLILSEFSVTSEMDGATLQCRHSCSDGAQGAETSQFLAMQGCESVETPPSASFNLSITKHWVVGQTAVFSFSTESSIAPPKHHCYLQYQQLKENEQKISEYVASKAPLQINTVDFPLQIIDIRSNSEQRKNSSGFYLETFFEVPLLSIHHNGKIFCGIGCNSHKIGSVSQRLPQLLEPCSTLFLLPPNSSWIDGAAVNLTADSSEGNRVATSHICFLQSAGVPNSTLRIVSSTNSSSTFSVPVSRHWGSSASVACLVNQSGLIETWARHPLPSVLYPVQNASISLGSLQLRENRTARILLVASELGNPPARHACHISGRELKEIKAPSSSNASSLWTFDALASDNGKRILCEIIQMDDSNKTLFNILISSGALDVLYASNNSWNATQPLVMKEGDPLSVSLRSVGGTPERSHRCWLQAASGNNISLAEINVYAKDEQDKMLITKFTASSTRLMNGGSMRCRVSQGGQLADMDFEQNVTVLYPATPPEIIALAPTVYEGVRLNFSVRSGDGNPKANLSCSAQRGSIESLGARQNSVAMGFTPDRRDTSVQCSAVQMYNSRTVFSSSCSQNVSVMYSANNSLLTGPSAHITEGSDLSVTLVSVGGKPAVRNLSCWAGGVPLTAENSTFGTKSQLAGRSVRHLKLEAVKRSLNGKLLSCVFEQDGNLVQWKNTSLAVFYPVQNASIRLSAGRVRSGSAAQFALLASEWGNPPARHFCHLAERALQQEPLQFSTEASTVWKFTPLNTDNGLRISCQLLQIASNGLIVFNLLVVSAALNVLYEVQSEWTATQLQLLNEGEHLAVSLKSLGGNPEPSHRCWQQTADGHVISASHLLKQSRKAAQLETSFRVKAERWMNGGCVICKVIQEGLGDGERIFRKNLSVIFPSRVISWSGGLLNGSELNLTVETSEGNPRPMLSCSLSPGSFGSERLAVIPEPDRIGRNRGWIRRARLTHRFTEQQTEVTVACLLSQPYAGSVNLFKAVERKMIIRAVFASARRSSPSSGSGAIAALCCSLAAAVAVGGAATAAVLKRMRAATAAGRRGAMELPAAAKPADPNTVYYYEGN